MDGSQNLARSFISWTPCGRSWLVAIINSLGAAESGDRAGEGGRAPQVFFALSPSFVPRMNERIYSAGGMDGRRDGPRTRCDVEAEKERRFQRQRERERETMGLCVRLSK